MSDLLAGTAGTMSESCDTEIEVSTESRTPEVMHQESLLTRLKARLTLTNMGRPVHHM